MNPFFLSAQLLHASGVPHLVIGGFAVVMHGVNRFTPDVNVLIDFESDKIPALIDSLAANGFEMPPCDYQKVLSDAQARTDYYNEGQNWFLSFHSIAQPSFRLDITVHHPLPFLELKQDAVQVSLEEGVSLDVCSLEALKQMKASAARNQDQLDLQSLEIVTALQSGGDLSAVDEERVENLRTFQSLSHSERVDWLGRMLDQIAAFVF